MAKTPKALHPITCYDEDTDSFAMPDDVAAVPVVVCTLVTAARLVDKGLPRGHFAYILVDEAAQAKEAEAVVPLALLDPAAGGRLVLGGDPCQLGPVVASNVAKEHGLEVSLMERLMRDFPRYRPGAGGAAGGTTFDPAAIVRLVANYRSHGALLTVPSVLFYGGELLERADRSETGALLGLPAFGGTDFPFLFHAVEGRQERQGTNPSWFNADEAAAVLDHVRALRGAGVAPADVVVLSPYRAQIAKVDALLGRHGCPGVRVASTEEFQGGEVTAVVITTVRSATVADAPVPGGAMSLGFLASPKRFNVAITRAKAALIVVGSPHLAADEHYAALIAHAQGGGGYRGAPLPMRYEQKVAAAAERLRAGGGGGGAGATAKKGRGGGGSRAAGETHRREIDDDAAPVAAENAISGNVPRGEPPTQGVPTRPPAVSAAAVPKSGGAWARRRGRAGAPGTVATVGRGLHNSFAALSLDDDGD